ncbi:MAG: efflux RND transporter permease subunit [Steroidobacteraceae bacterium]
MRGLVALCVSRRGLVALASVLALLLGIEGARRVPLDVFPEFVPVQVEVQTEAPGMTPEQVEARVTRPIEAGLNGVQGLVALRSESIPGLSVVKINFADDADVWRTRQAVAERLAEIGPTLPSVAGVPRLSPLVSSTMDLLKVGLVSDRIDAFALRDAAEWVIKPHLLAVPGVAHVILFGGAVREFRITPDPLKLEAWQFTLADVAAAARSALQLRGAGVVDLASQRVLVQAPAPKADPQVLRDAVLATRGGRVIRIADVARVDEQPAIRSGDALIMGRPGVLMSLASQYGANTLSTTRAVEDVLAELKPTLQAQGIQIVPGMQRPANFIETALGNLTHSLLLSCVLILAILYVFLRSARAAFVAFVTIPLSLVAGIGVLQVLGATLNTMTIGGFAVALGVLVDDAIIGIENVRRRLRQDRTGSQAGPWETIVAATLEVRAPVVYATAVVIVVFLPELLLGSVEGRFVGPLALAFMVAVMASLLVALTVTPALCAWLLAGDSVAEDPGWILALKGLQRRTLLSVRHRLWPSLLLTLGALVAALALVPFLGGRFMPEFREGHFVVQMSASLPGVSLDDMTALGRRVSASLLKLPYVATVSQQVGRADLSEDTWGPHRSEFHVELKPDSSVDPVDAQEAIRRIVEGVPGVQTEVVSFLGDRISESLSGESGQVVVKLYGNDLDTLDHLADQAVSVLQSLSGVMDLQFRRQSGSPLLSVEPRPDALARFGLRAGDLLDTLGAAFAGESVGEVQDGLRTIRATMLLGPEWRGRADSLQNLPVATPFGPVRLGTLANVRMTEGRYSIDHDGAARRVVVSFNVTGRSVAGAADEARAKLQQTMRLPAGVSLSIEGAGAAEAQARSELLLYSAMSLALILGILYAAFRWPRNAWLVLANLPFSLVGGIFATAMLGLDLSLGVAVGLVTVFGISARNSILLLAHYEHMVLVEERSWDIETALTGASERLVPILMTAAVTALGLVPLALGLHRPGQEIEGPMAVTVLGGLASSTLLNLVLLPVLAERWAGIGKPAMAVSTPDGAKQGGN